MGLLVLITLVFQARVSYSVYKINRFKNRYIGWQGVMLIISLTSALINCSMEIIKENNNKEETISWLIRQQSALLKECSMGIAINLNMRIWVNHI